MKRVTIVGISLVIFIISLFVLYFFPHIDGEAVKYVMTENGPKFKELEGKLYDVEEYKEGHYYLVDDDELIVETTIQEWKKKQNAVHFIINLQAYSHCKYSGLFPSRFLLSYA